MEVRNKSTSERKFECQAFFPLEKGEIRESLKDHLRLTLRQMDEIFIKRGFHLRIASLAGIGREESRNCLRVAAILHDVGKGVEYYQIKMKGFAGHGYISAYLAYNCISDKLSDIRKAIALAIGLHHHTMTKQFCAPIWREKALRLRQACLDQIEDLIKEVELEALISLDNLEKPIFPKKIKKWWKRIREKLPDPRLIKETYLILYPLMISDNLAASARPGTPTMLGREASRAYGGIIR